MTETWSDLFKLELSKPYMISLMSFLKEEYKNQNVCPPITNIFRAFTSVRPCDIKVVIVSQDPYPGLGHANGLAFAVNEGITIPGSLKNIFKEIHQEFGVQPQDRTLLSWARQGVFLLNTTLTTRQNQSLSHKGKGWENFTDTTISFVNNLEQPICFILLGNHALNKKSLVTSPQHLVLSAVHPSPLSASRGFFGSNIFKKANEWLGTREIQWAQ